METEEILVIPLLHPREDPEETADCLTDVTLNLRGSNLYSKIGERIMNKDTVPNSQMIAGLILAQEAIINMLIESNALNRDEVIVRFSQIVKDMGDEPGDISDIPLRVIARKLAGESIDDLIGFSE